MTALPSVRQLRAFVAIYELGQLSAAAEHLSLTQPAVTVLLRELEAKVGVRLFDRSTRSLQRTPAAEELIGYAMRALEELHALTSRLGDYSSGRQGRFRLAATSTVAQTMLPPLLRDFADSHPEVQVTVRDCGPMDFVAMLAHERADLGVGTLEAPVPGLVQRVFLRDPLVAVAPRGPGFASDTPLTWRELCAHPLLIVKPGYGIRRLIDGALAQQDLLPEVRVQQEVSLLTTALAMAAAGLAVAVVPRSIVEHSPFPGLVARRLTQPDAERPMAVICKEGRPLPPAAVAFARTLVPDLPAGWPAR